MKWKLFCYHRRQNWNIKHKYILTKYNISPEINVRAMQCSLLSILTIPIRKLEWEYFSQLLFSVCLLVGWLFHFWIISNCRKYIPSFAVILLYSLLTSQVPITSWDWPIYCQYEGSFHHYFINNNGILLSLFVVIVFCDHIFNFYLLMPIISNIKPTFSDYWATK